MTSAFRAALLAISVALSGLAGPVLAAPFLEVRTRAAELDSQQALSIDQVNNDSQTGTLTPGEIVQSSVNGAAFKGKADFGSLGVHAHLVMNEQQRQLVASGLGLWQDTVHISSDNAALATVSIQVDLLIDIAALTSTIASPSPASFAYARTQFITNFVPGNGYCLAQNVGLQLAPALCDGYAPLQVGTNLIQFVMEVPVGDQEWQAHLIGEAQILDEAAGQTSGEVLIDAFNTAHTYFTVLTAGASIVFDSGHDYSAPVGAAVPAPATLALLGLGLAGLGFVRRRKNP